MAWRMKWGNESRYFYYSISFMFKMRGIVCGTAVRIGKKNSVTQ